MDALSGLKSISYRIGKGTWQAYTGSFSLAGMNAGEYTITHKATDNVLNEETEKALTVNLIVIEVSKEVASDSAILIGAWRHHKEHDDHETEGHDTEKSIDRKEDNGNGHDKDDKDGSECLPDRLDKLTGILTSAGIAHYVPNDEEDFIYSFRSGRYNTYILLDEDDHLEDMGEEIREAVHYGQGLIYFKTKPDEEHRLRDVLGVEFKGKTANKNLEVTLLNSPISSEGNFETEGRSIVTAITTTSAQSYATMIDKHKTYPAIVYNEYGRGRTLFYAFDLLSALDEAKAAALLIDSVNHVRPDEQEPFAHGSMPIRIKLDNSTEPVDVRVQEYLPDATTADTIMPVTPVIDGILTWDRSIKAGEKLSFGYHLNLPDIAGNYPVESKIFYSNFGDYRLYRTYFLTLTVAEGSDDLLRAAISGLEAMRAGLPDSEHDCDKNDEEHGEDKSWDDECKGNNREHITHAIKELNRIDAFASDRKAAEKNIERTRKAIEVITKMTVDVTEIRLTLDELLKVWEKKWYLIESEE